MQGIKYRPEIDGLRAISVFAVIFYHANFMLNGFPLFQGGFLGVDIFFVISGYLIGSILLNSMKSENFSFGAFYERRARRILPMLFTILATSIPFAWLYLLPGDFVEYARSLLASIFFSSNYFFWRTGNQYAAEPSLLKPLLHTWSLSIEEQFYLLFPFILFWLYPKLKNNLSGILIGVITASFVFAEWCSYHNPSQGFYGLPSRIWELLAGVWLAQHEINTGRIEQGLRSRLMPWLGLMLILLSFLFFGDTMPHPSFITVLPVTGALLLIRFSKPETWNGRLLSSKILVALGVISYSLYLWHFPIFAFARIVSPQLSDFTKWALIFLTLVLSITSYFWVEQPFRNKQQVKGKACVSNAIQKMILAQPNAIVIIGGRYPVLLTESFFNNEEGGIEERKMPVYWQPLDKILLRQNERKKFISEAFISSIDEMLGNGNKVILVYPIPEAGWHVPNRLFQLMPKNPESQKQFLKSMPITTSLAVYKKRTKSAFDLFDQIKHPNVYRVYPHTAFCSTSIPNRCLTHDDKNVYYYDRDHPSQKGSEMIVNELMKALETIQRQSGPD